MAGSVGVEGLSSDLEHPELRAQSVGPGAYHRLIDALRELRDEPVLLEPLRAAWAGRRFHAWYSRHLLLLASLRYLALAQRDHPLAPEVLLDAEAPELGQRLRQALADPRLVEVLATRSVQTNEPGRAIGWGLVSLVLGLGHQRWSLADLGCSAGFNLVVDRTSSPFRLGNERLTGVDFPSPRRRLGLDVAPVDLGDEAQLRWLRACVWPGQRQRLARQEACLKVYHGPWRGDAPAPEIRQHTLGRDDTGQVLAELVESDSSEVVLAFESVVADYLPPAAARAYDDALSRWLLESPTRIWVRLNPAPDRPHRGGPMSLTAHIGRRDQPQAFELARTGYHPEGCVPLHDGIRAFMASWESR